MRGSSATRGMCGRHWRSMTKLRRALRGMDLGRGSRARRKFRSARGPRASRSRSVLNGTSTKVAAVSAMLTFIRHVDRLPDVRLELMGEAFLASDLRLSIADRLPTHRQRDRAGELTRLRKRRKEAGGFVVARGEVLDQLLGSGLDHRIGHATRLGSDDSKRKAGKYVRVVGLRDVKALATKMHRTERAASADQRPPFGPVHQVLRRRFAARGWVREPKDHRAIHLLSHFADGLFGESSRLPRCSNQH